MPSEYTDEIENSSYTRRTFSMGRKSKYSAEEKLCKQLAVRINFYFWVVNNFSK